MFWLAFLLFVVIGAITVWTGSAAAGFWIPVSIFLVLGSSAGYFVLTADSRNRKAAEQALSEPVGLELPSAILPAVKTITHVRRTKGHPGRVIVQDEHFDNWEAIAEEVEAQDNSVTNYAIELVADPKNPDREHAVLATMGGLVLGMIPNVESERLFDFIMRKGGIVRVNAEQKFGLASNKFELSYSVDADLEVVKKVVRES